MRPTNRRKHKKEIEALDVERHKIVFPNAAERDARHAFSIRLRDVVIANLEAISSADAYDIRKTWEFNVDSHTYDFDLTFALAVEVEANLDDKRTKHGALKVIFSFALVEGCDIDTSISVLDDEIRRFKKGLHELRSLQLKHVLATQGVEAYEAAVSRS